MACTNVSLLSLVAVLAFAARAAIALSPISVKGTKLYDEDGKQFFVKGVAYNPLPLDADHRDPLIDTKRCQIDAGLISELGANTIRVYEVEGDGDHDGCMEIFANAGIYVWLDLPSVEHSYNRVTPVWTRTMYDAWTRTVDNFAEHDNLLFFTIGNEVLYADTLDPAPYIKAAVRDVKAFRNARGYRPIPIIYAANDEMQIRALTSEYLACGDEEEAVDAFGINVYSWCGDSSFYEAGYDKIYEEFQDLNIPVLFSETGCKPDKGDRKFPDVEAMLGKSLQAVFSGLVVYEWAMHANEYGIVEYPTSSLGEGFPTTMAEYNSLSVKFATMNPTGTSRNRYTPSNSPPECPDSMFGWATREALPTIRGLNVATVTQRASWSESITRTNEGSRTGTGPTDSSETGGSGQGGGSGQNQNEEQNGSEGDGGGLSAGAIGGIAAGIAVVVLAGIAAAVFFFLRKRKAQKAASTSQGGNDAQVYEKSGNPITAYEVAAPTPELDAGDQYSSQELDAQHGYYGPGSKTNPVELDSHAPQIPGGR